MRGIVEGRNFVAITSQIDELDGQSDSIDMRCHGSVVPRSIAGDANKSERASYIGLIELEES
jgi:hypothetical protein